VSQTEKEFVYKNDDALLVRNILSFYRQILPQFVKPPSDTLLRYRDFVIVPSVTTIVIYTILA
jgi:hypothetical protein